MELQIRHAYAHETGLIEGILCDAVLRMQEKKTPMWSLELVKWPALGYAPTDFVLCFRDGQPIATMALLEQDLEYRPEIPKGEALFIHKLAVHRSAAGQGIGTAMLDFAVQEAAARGIALIRLDVYKSREKLRQFYEGYGFVYEKEASFYGCYEAAFYQYAVAEGMAKRGELG